jgi:SAM-dependent methyltransferase
LTTTTIAAPGYAEDESQRVVGRRLGVSLTRYGLANLSVLDVACGEGEYLRSFGSGSVGLELQLRNVQTARAQGLDVRQCDLEGERYPLDARRYDAVWLSNYLEHSLAPHRLLIRLREYLRDDGRLLVTVPKIGATAMERKLFERWPPWRGAYAADHVNFFTLHTARATIAGAGYRVEEIVAPSIPSPLLARILVTVWPTVMLVARKIADWSYPAKAHKTLLDGRIVPRE